jgi:hypothetical protein
MGVPLGHPHCPPELGRWCHGPVLMVSTCIRQMRVQLSSTPHSAAQTMNLNPNPHPPDKALVHHGVGQSPHGCPGGAQPFQFLLPQLLTCPRGFWLPRVLPGSH